MRVLVIWTSTDNMDEGDGEEESAEDYAIPFDYTLGYLYLPGYGDVSQYLGSVGGHDPFWPLWDPGQIPATWATAYQDQGDSTQVYSEAPGSQFQPAETAYYFDHVGSIPDTSTSQGMYTLFENNSYSADDDLSLFDISLSTADFATALEQALPDDTWETGYSHFDQCSVL